jgi:hypothetical protein
MVEMSIVAFGRLLNARKLESSCGIVPELLIMMRCVRDGRIGEGEDNDIEGTRCFRRGICDRTPSLGVVRKILVSSVKQTMNSTYPLSAKQTRAHPRRRQD